MRLKLSKARKGSSYESTMKPFCSNISCNAVLVSASSSTTRILFDILFIISLLILQLLLHFDIIIELHMFIFCYVLARADFSRLYMQAFIFMSGISQAVKCQAVSSPNTAIINPIAGYIEYSNTKVHYILCLFYFSRQ